MNAVVNEKKVTQRNFHTGNHLSISTPGRYLLFCGGHAGARVLITIAGRDHNPEFASTCRVEDFNSVEGVILQSVLMIKPLATIEYYMEDVLNLFTLNRGVAITKTIDEVPLEDDVLLPGECVKFILKTHMIPGVNYEYRYITRGAIIFFTNQSRVLETGSSENHNPDYPWREIHHFSTVRLHMLEKGSLDSDDKYHIAELLGLGRHVGYKEVGVDSFRINPTILGIDEKILFALAVV